jgi:hypothetical protein
MNALHLLMPFLLVRETECHRKSYSHIILPISCRLGAALRFGPLGLRDQVPDLTGHGAIFACSHPLEKSPQIRIKWHRDLLFALRHFSSHKSPRDTEPTKNSSQRTDIVF